MGAKEEIPLSTIVHAYTYIHVFACEHIYVQIYTSTYPMRGNVPKLTKLIHFVIYFFNQHILIKYLPGYRHYSRHFRHNIKWYRQGSLPDGVDSPVEEGKQ